MEEPDSPSEVVEELRTQLSGSDDVEFAVLFGSHVTGAPTDGSDLDLAIKFRDDLEASERFRRRCTLSGELQASHRPFVDVADIETLPIEVARDAVSGELIYGDEDRFRSVRERILTTYRDERERIRQRHRDVIDRIAEDGLHG